MFRFSIRDLFWLTIVAGLTVGWWLERNGPRQRFHMTGQPLDVSIEGDGYLVFENDYGTKYYVRSCQLHLDPNGYLTTLLSGSELKLCPNINMPSDVATVVINPGGDVMGGSKSAPSDHETFSIFGQVYLALFDDSASLYADEANAYFLCKHNKAPPPRLVNPG